MLNKPPVLRFCHKIDKHTAAVDVITLLPPGEFAFHFHHLNRAISIGQHKIRGIVRRRELHIAVFFFRQHSKPAVQLYLHDLATLDFGQNSSHVVVILAPAVKLVSGRSGGIHSGFQRCRCSFAPAPSLCKLLFRLCPVAWRQVRKFQSHAHGWFLLFFRRVSGFFFNLRIKCLVLLPVICCSHSRRV